MKKILFIMVIITLLMTGCEELNEENKIELNLYFDKVKCSTVSTKRNKGYYCYYFDSSSDKTIEISKNHSDYAYREGTYSGDFNSKINGCYDNFKDKTKPCVNIEFDKDDIEKCDKDCKSKLKKELIESGHYYKYKK